MTDQPFTPSTEQVRRAYVQGMRNAFIDSASAHEAEFDRWLNTINPAVPGASGTGVPTTVEELALLLSEPDGWVNLAKALARLDHVVAVYQRRAWEKLGLAREVAGPEGEVLTQEANRDIALLARMEEALKGSA